MKINESRLVAHRGYAARYPENTRLAMSKAISVGALYLECDIQLTSDHVPILHHDANTKISTGDKKNVLESRLEELRCLSFGEPARFGDQFPNTAITTLADMVPLLTENRAVQLFVELKEESIKRYGAELMVKKVMTIIGPVIDQCIVISFDEQAVMEAKKQGWKKTGWVLRRWNNKSRTIAKSFSPDYIFCNYKKITPTSGSLWSGPWKWALYEIIDHDLAEKWFAIGTDLVETMEIEKMIDGACKKGPDDI